MNDQLEKNICFKAPGLNNPETYVLTHNRFKTHLVLIFSDLNKAQVYEMPCKVCSYDEIGISMSFYHLNLCKPNEHTEDYHIIKSNDENFLFELEKKVCLCWR